MDNNDQKLVDFLYEQIFVQQLRCNYFETLGQTTPNSVWNRVSDEKNILNIMITNYRQYYTDKAELIKIKLCELKEYNIASYLTYDKEYYVNLYNAQIETVNKYIVSIENKTMDHISTKKLSYISDDIDTLFNGFILNPTLLNKLQN